jgi:hypothetical protein
MELQHHKFCYSGSDMNFAVFSDDSCRVSYVESIAIPIGHTQVQLYGIEPGARTKWIVVKQLDGHKATLKVFLRQNEKFLENEIDDLPRETRSQIMQRFPNLAAEEKPRWQVKTRQRGRSKGKKLGQGVQKSVAPAVVTIEKRRRENRPNCC